MGRLPRAPAEGKDEIDLDDLLESDESDSGEHQQQHYPGSSLPSLSSMESILRSSAVMPLAAASSIGSSSVSTITTPAPNPTYNNNVNTNSNAWIKPSEAIAPCTLAQMQTCPPPVTTQSLESIMQDEAQRQAEEEKEATRLAEIAQEEELVRMAMEMSLSEIHMESNHSSSYGSEEQSSATVESEQEQLEKALRESLNHQQQQQHLDTLPEEEPDSRQSPETAAETTTALPPPTAASSLPPLGGKQSSLSSLVAGAPKTPRSQIGSEFRRCVSFDPTTASASDDGGSMLPTSASSPLTPSPSPGIGNASSLSYRSPIIRRLGSSFQSLEELSPADFAPRTPQRVPSSTTAATATATNCSPSKSPSSATSSPSISHRKVGLPTVAPLADVAETDATFKESASKLSSSYDLSGAEKHLPAEELRLIEQALMAGSPEEDSVSASEATAEPAPITDAEAAAIDKALREADEEDENKSLLLALKIQQEEANQHRQQPAARHTTPQGNVRTMTRAEYMAEQSRGSVGAFRSSGPILRHPLEDEENVRAAAGFRLNAAQPHQWARRDHNSVVGPNQEVRTKHDAELHAQANAHRLGLDMAEDGMALLGNRAYNSFMQSVKQKKKGVAAHGTGRAGSDADSTRGGAMDPSVRVLIAKAINNGLIEVCNGVVKEGKEAIVYHANQGEESEGFDVAVKVFKRIQEFKARGDYVDGDPRYAKADFRHSGSREQLELWTEKEFRNLIRANRAGVPVPSPLMHKDNVLFMRFIGAEGWPSPQLRELDIRKGSSKWGTLFNLILKSIQRLYTTARLVHADLSEYNILVAPSRLIEHPSEGVGEDDLQPVLIDFGQAVDIRHPAARSLLERDVDRVITFFRRQGIETMSTSEALSFVVNEAELRTI